VYGTDAVADALSTERFCGTAAAMGAAAAVVAAAAAAVSLALCALRVDLTPGNVASARSWRSIGEKSSGRVW